MIKLGPWPLFRLSWVLVNNKVLYSVLLNAKKNGFSKSVNLRYKTVLMSVVKGVVMQRSSVFIDGFQGSQTNKNV